MPTFKEQVKEIMDVPVTQAEINKYRDAAVWMRARKVMDLLAAGLDEVRADLSRLDSETGVFTKLYR